MHRAPLSGALAAAATGVLADVAVDPVHHHVPLCPLRAATGIWCPLCGSLRAVDALAHADVTAALRDNALLVAALPLLLFVWFDRLARLDRHRPARRLTRTGRVVIIAVTVLFTAARNLPVGSALHP